MVYIRYMEELEKAFYATFYDKILSKPERQALLLLLNELKPSQHEQAWLRSRIFDWVQHELKDYSKYELLAWLEEANKLIASVATPPDKEQVCFSPGDGCLLAILQQLRMALHTIHICVFTISDDRISKEIINCHTLGKQVRIITDNEKLYDTGSDIDRLAKVGIPVKIDRTTNHMHHKFAVIDSKLVLTGSYNWTRSAASFNHENLLITHTKSVVTSFEEEFARLWEQLVDY